MELFTVLRYSETNFRFQIQYNTYSRYFFDQKFLFIMLQCSGTISLIKFTITYLVSLISVQHSIPIDWLSFFGLFGVDVISVASLQIRCTFIYLLNISFTYLQYFHRALLLLTCHRHSSSQALRCLIVSLIVIHYCDSVVLC